MATEKRLIDANLTNADSCETAKIKTHFAKVVVSIIEGKQYYDILWLDPIDGNYHIGYGSYNIDFVFQWFSKYFEMVDAPHTEPNESYPEVGGCPAFKSKDDFVKVVRCKDCKHYGRIKGLVGLRCNLQDNQIWCKDDFCSYGERRTEC